MINPTRLLPSYFFLHDKPKFLTLIAENDLEEEAFKVQYWIKGKGSN